MSYGLVARCGRTGRLGYGVASPAMAVGHTLCDAVRAGTGVAITLGSPRPANNLLALRLLAQGFSSAQTLQGLRDNDPGADTRQIIIMDRDGKAAAETGPLTKPWSGHRTCQDLAVFGDALAGDAIIDAIAQSFTNRAEDTLEERLLMALEAGHAEVARMSGSGAVPARSAALCAYGVQDYSDWDLRVGRA
jgi:uncharacterized Ntn-hydrolase superfamily protein